LPLSVDKIQSAQKAEPGESAFIPGRDQGSAHKIPGASGKVVRMKLIGSNPSPRATGVDPLPGKSNYFIGNDSAKWRTDVPNYAKVRYEDVYPGIDLVYYGNQRRLEYDWIVAPGADPGLVSFAVENADKPKIDKQGNLLIGWKRRTAPP
jgi:hypothetical protein